MASCPVHFSDLANVRLESANWAKADIDQIAVTNRSYETGRRN
jgi:hypothetical protein